MEFDVRPHEAYDVPCRPCSSCLVWIELVVAMDREEHHDAMQREASAAGLVWGILFLLLACIALLLGLIFWPVIQSAPPA